MNKPTFLLFSALFYVGLAGANVIRKDDPIYINLKLIATVDGKSYFTDPTTRTWPEAKNFCGGMGMKLADITSQAQFDALKAAYSPTDFHGDYWTSGRDIQERQQFAWDSTGAQFNNNYPAFSHNQYNPTYQTCVFYWSESQSSRHSVSFEKCDFRKPTLCQT